MDQMNQILRFREDKENNKKGFMMKRGMGILRRICFLFAAELVFLSARPPFLVNAGLTDQDFVEREESVEENDETSDDSPGNEDELSIQNKSIEDYEESNLDEESEEFTAERALARSNQVQSEGDERLVLLDGVQKAEKKNYTLMIYMIGSDLEANGGYATRDLDEIVNAGVDYSKSNILVYTGGSKMWHSNITSETNNVLDMSRPENDRVVVSTEGNADMGSPGTLQAFLDFSADYFPADHYALIFWDHGGGTVYGYGSDALYRGDSLLLHEMGEALSASAFGKGFSLDWVGFDACLMSTMENAVLWANFTDCLVASEETEPGDGWSYDFLKLLNETDDPTRITAGIVDNYAAYYAEKRTPLNDPDVTLAVLDLREASEVVNALNQLAEKMKDQLETDRKLFPSLSQRHGRVKMFGVRSDEGRGGAFDLLDVKDLADQMADLFPDQSKALQDALKKMVAVSTDQVEGANGVSLYFPGENRDLYRAVRGETVSSPENETEGEEGTLTGSAQTGKQISEADRANFFCSDTFRRFTERYAERWTASSDADWTVAEPTVGEEEITLQLTDEQMNNLGEASYTILLDHDGHYVPVMSRVRLVPDKEKVLHIPADPQLICGLSGSRVIPFSFLQTDETDGGRSFNSTRMVAAKSGVFEEINWAFDSEVVLSLEEKEDILKIKNVSYAENDMAAIGKTTVDLSEYIKLLNFVYTGDYLAPSWNEDGSVKPFYDWDAGDGSGYTSMEIDQGAEFVFRPLSSTEKKAILQILLTDVNGQDHASNVVTIGEDKENAESSGSEGLHLETPAGGTLTFELQEDGDAILTNYSGEDTSLTVPSQVEGHPVRTIATGALYYEDKLSELEFEEGIRRIERQSVNYCSALKKIKLPSSLETIGYSPITDCQALKEIEIRGGSCPCAVTVDGVLFSADKQVLLYCPAGIGTHYQIPEGTRELAYGAFEHTGLVQVRFPESLKAIGSYCFYNAANLRALDFPASLETIGDAAFLSDDFGKEEDTRLVLDTIYIGPNLRKIGGDAFQGLRIRQFVVDPANRSYSSVNGMILTRAGDVVLICPSEIGGVVNVPDGVTGLAETVFYDLNPDTVFILPDSLRNFSSRAFPYYSDPETLESEYRLTIYCGRGSTAEAFAASSGMPYETSENIEDIKRDNTYIVRTIPGLTGEATYYLYHDHAALVRYRGKVCALTVPENVEGLPITEIGNGRDALFEGTEMIFPEKSAYQPQTMDKVLGRENWSIRMPDCIRVIHPNALSGVGGDAEGVLDLPASLESFSGKSMGDSILTSESTLSAFRISEDNPDFCTVDGILYSKDKKTLVCFPTGLSMDRQKMKIPEGVEEIGPYAFLGFKAGFNEEETMVYADMVFPESLRRIGENAFAGARLGNIRWNDGLEEIGDFAFADMVIGEVRLELPESVITIGNSAFKNVSTYSSDESETSSGFSEIRLPDRLKSLGKEAFFSYASTSEKTPCDVIHINRELKDIGTDAFAGILTAGFEVEKGNRQFSAIDGMLFSDEGKTLLVVPSRSTGDIYIPEGTVRVASHALTDCVGIENLYVPESVTGFGKKAIYYTSYDISEEDYMSIHCTEDSVAAKYAEMNGFPCIIE